MSAWTKLAADSTNERALLDLKSVQFQLQITEFQCEMKMTSGDFVNNLVIDTSSMFRYLCSRIVFVYARIDITCGRDRRTLPRFQSGSLKILR